MTEVISVPFCIVPGLAKLMALLRRAFASSLLPAVEKPVITPPAPTDLIQLTSYLLAFTHPSCVLQNDDIAHGMKKKIETAPHHVTETGTTAIGAMKGAMMTGEETIVVLVERIIANATEKESQTATGKGHDVTRTTARIDATTEKTGNRRVGGAKTANVLRRLTVGRLHRRTQSLFPRGSAKRPDGMLQLQDTSNIQLCKPSKPVGWVFSASYTLS